MGIKDNISAIPDISRICIERGIDPDVLQFSVTKTEIPLHELCNRMRIRNIGENRVQR